MNIDILIILAYFIGIMALGLMSRSKDDVTAEEYFISSRSLRSIPCCVLAVTSKNGDGEKENK